MSVQDVIGKVGAKVLGVGKSLLQADAAADLAEELELLLGERDQLDDQLATLRGQAALLGQRVADHEPLDSSLPAEIASSLRRDKQSQALRLALELERVRRAIDDDRAEMKRIEETVWCLEFRLRQLDRRVERLREGRPTR